MSPGADRLSPVVWAIVVAGGSGNRYGMLKQYELLAGRAVLEWSVDAAASVADGVVVVVPSGHVDQGHERFSSASVTDATALIEVVAGGESRAESVRAGLAQVPDDAGVILVHDAARPAASPDLFAQVVAAVRAIDTTPGTSGVVPAVPVTDSIRHRRDGAVDRTDLVAVQTPQGFLASRLRAAHASGMHATDDATLVEALGDKIAIIDGEATNLKLTHPHDRALLEATLATRSNSEARP